ncbi:Hypothetical predicted protein [Podarcis lilfordi]|uniref:Testis expressed 50 n=1 Tax=Podarcis lilfordi TaxID=74358 RepID=A0AA35KF59_9SAUR|nr:Hypothetical predicted protein [Podarcis lilfordi]
MFSQGPCQVSLLWTVLLFQDVIGFCERPAWTRVAWEMTPQDLELLATKQQSNCFRDSMCQVCHCFTGLGLSKESLEVVYAGCKVAFLIVSGLVVHYLFIKLKLKLTLAKPTTPCRTIVQAPAFPVATKVNDEYTHNMDKMLYRLVANTSKMMKYMKHVAHRYKKEVKYRKLSKKSKADEFDEDEQFFPICPHNHSSSGDT